MAAVGVDIGKDFVDVASEAGEKRVQRTRTALLEHFSKLPSDSFLVLEATGRYHRMVLEVAETCGFDAHVVDPYVFSLYRKSMSPRAKNDRIDARILKRFGERELDRLSKPNKVGKNIQRLKDLLELRETQVRLRVAWEQSMSELEHLPKGCQEAAESIRRSIDELESEIHSIVEGDPIYLKFLEMDGVGTQLAPALVWLFRAFHFESTDQVVAFVGLDVRVRESGKYIGQRKLTKRGPAFLRRLLYCGANSGRCIQAFQPLYERHHRKGLRTKGVNAIISRKILRAAFVIATSETQYNREVFIGNT